MYIVRTYECTSQILIKLTQMVQNYSELYLAVPPPRHCWLPPETSCVTCRRILDLKK
jgi:hypothetical protein